MGNIVTDRVCVTSKVERERERVDEGGRGCVCIDGGEGCWKKGMCAGILNIINDRFMGWKREVRKNKIK